MADAFFFFFFLNPVLLQPAGILAFYKVLWGPLGLTDAREKRSSLPGRNPLLSHQRGCWVLVGSLSVVCGKPSLPNILPRAKGEVFPSLPSLSSWYVAAVGARAGRAVPPSPL